MKKLIISGVFSSVLMLGGLQVVAAEETTTAAPKTQAEQLAQIEQLMKLIADLQTQLAAARGEINELMSDLSEGAQGDDVKNVQEILATDPSIFGVKPTGYFGPMTREALKKFQMKYELQVTGILDKATREVMKELRKERVKGMVPPGLLRSTEVHDRIRDRLMQRRGGSDEVAAYDDSNSDDNMDDDSENDN